MSNINVFADTLMKYLHEYTDEVSEGLEEAKEEIAKETVKVLKSTSPKRYGKYGKAWRTKKIGSAQVIHVAKPHYRLAHLLEKGHAKRGGGRVPGRPHIAPAEEQAIKKFEERVEKVIRG